MPRALILGASGQIGQAAALALHADGYELLLADRGNQPLLAEVTALGATRVVVDRHDPDALGAAVGDGVDLLVDVIGFTADDGRALLALDGRVGAMVVISSASVYADGDGNALDGLDDHPFPHFDGPIRETGRLVEPGPATYASRKVDYEQVLLGQDRVPVAVLRPAAVHGPGERHAREWWVVKRALDARAHLLVAHADHRFHTSSAPNLGALISAAAARRAHGAWNAADPQALTTGEVVGALVAAVQAVGGEVDQTLAGWSPQVQAFDASPGEEVGMAPWSFDADLVLDMTAATRDLGYEPVTDYRGAVASTVRWLVTQVGHRADWLSILTRLDIYGPTFLNYAAEDVYVTGVSGASTSG